MSVDTYQMFLCTEDGGAGKSWARLTLAETGAPGTEGGRMEHGGKEETPGQRCGHGWLAKINKHSKDLGLWSGEIQMGLGMERETEAGNNSATT